MFYTLIAPLLFVLIWSTGWIVAKYIVPFADPFTFLSVRYACAIVVVGLFAQFAGAQWPRGRAMAHALVSGVLLHAFYLGGVWFAIRHGVPAGLSALIAAVQPLLTALLAPKLAREKLKFVHLSGVFIGFVGVMGVVAPKMQGYDLNAMDGLKLALVVNVLAMISVTLGTFYQKRFISTGDLRSVTALQYVGALVVTLPFALMFEDLRFVPSFETWAALAWSVLVLSIGAIGLMLMMIRHGAISKMAALLYLVPPTAALQAYFMFGETLNFTQIAFMGLAALGVFLATQK